MRLFALRAAGAIPAMLSFGAIAADLVYPPPVVEQPQYGMAPAVAPPAHVIIGPGPSAPPEYDGAALAPPPVGPSPYNIGPRADVAPHSVCPPSWRCSERDCSWQRDCAPYPERYFGPYGSPGPQVYPSPGDSPRSQVYPDTGLLPDSERYSGPNGSLRPQLYPQPSVPPTPERYPGQYTPPVYPGPSGPYSSDRSPYRP
jgi:hypothetical protein